MQTLQFILINLKYMTNIIVPVHMQKTYTQDSISYTSDLHTEKKSCHVYSWPNSFYTTGILLPDVSFHTKLCTCQHVTKEKVENTEIQKREIHNKLKYTANTIVCINIKDIKFFLHPK